MISWLGFFSPKGMLPYQSTQTYFHSALSSKTFVFVFCPSESWTEDGSADIADCLYRGLTLLHFFFFRSFSFFFVLLLPMSFVRSAMQTTFILSSYYILWNPLLLRPLCAERLVDLATLNRPLGQERLVLTGDPFPVGSFSHSWNDGFSQVIAGDNECEFWLKPSNTAPPVDLTDLLPFCESSFISSLIVILISSFFCEPI